MAEGVKRIRGKDLRFWNKKLQEKFKEALTAVLPIIAIVLVLSFTIAPITPSILLCFLMGALMVIVGMMFFTLGAETSMTPMGEAVGTKMTLMWAKHFFAAIGIIRRKRIAKD